MPCKLKTLAIANYYAYLRPKDNEDKIKYDQDLDKLGYEVIAGRDSDNNLYTKDTKNFNINEIESGRLNRKFKSGLGFCILKPKDKNDPYIFSFRGTDFMGKNREGDLKADKDLTLDGVVFNDYGEEAYEAFR